MTAHNDYEPGCYADGTFGHQHCRKRLAGLVADLGQPDHRNLLYSLYRDMPDDAWDEEEALEVLNDHTTLYWSFVDGDLMATAPEEEEPLDMREADDIKQEIKERRKA